MTTTDADRPAVWVLDPDGTSHKGREHGRDGARVLVMWTDERTALRMYRWVSAERVTPRQ